MRVHGLKSPGNDEARHAGVWTCAFLHAQLVMPCTGDGRERLHMGRKRGVVRAWPVVTVTDQGAPSEHRYTSTYFNMVWRKCVNPGAFEESATECRRSGRRVLVSRLTFGPNENSPPRQEIREPQRRAPSWTAIPVISGSLVRSLLSATGYL